MERLFAIDARTHGAGPVVYSWHPSSRYLASSGVATSAVFIWDRRGRLYHQILPPAKCLCIGLEWDADGSTLAILQGGPISASAASSAAAAAAASAGRTPTAAAAASSGSSSGSGEILLWSFGSKTIDRIDLPSPIRDPTFIKWSKTGNPLTSELSAAGFAAAAAASATGSGATTGTATTLNPVAVSSSVPPAVLSGPQLAIGTARGDVLLYDKVSRALWFASAKHRKRVTCGDWNREGKFAFASDDRQITIATGDGKTFGQVKVKSRPTNVKFGGNERDRENIVSVSMDRKTILLYNLDDPENALELAFQQRYGTIVSFQWFRDGYVMVGFSLGYLVVISTHMAEIGREQFCARFHKDALRDIAYCPLRHKVATCGDSSGAASINGGGGGGGASGTGACVKIVDMKDWKVEHQTDDLEADIIAAAAATTTAAATSPSTSAGAAASTPNEKQSESSAIANSFPLASSLPPGSSALDKLDWSGDGHCVSVSTRAGALIVYLVDAAASGLIGGADALSALDAMTAVAAAAAAAAAADGSAAGAAGGAGPHSLVRSTSDSALLSDEDTFIALDATTEPGTSALLIAKQKAALTAAAVASAAIAAATGVNSMDFISSSAASSAASAAAAAAASATGATSERSKWSTLRSAVSILFVRPLSLSSWIVSLLIVLCCIALALSVTLRASPSDLLLLLFDSPTF